jgi:hypothetical protein
MQAHIPPLTVLKGGGSSQSGITKSRNRTQLFYISKIVVNRTIVSSSPPLLAFPFGLEMGKKTLKKKIKSLDISISLKENPKERTTQFTTLKPFLCFTNSIVLCPTTTSSTLWCGIIIFLLKILSC